MGERVLVTGGTGFLGHHLVLRLRKLGANVRVFVRRDVVRSRKEILSILDDSGAELVYGDFSDQGSLQQAIQGISRVYHLAGRLFMPGVPIEEYEQLHVQGTRNLLEVCTQAAPLLSIVHCSSTGVLGPTGLEPLDEDARLNPSNTYESTKAEGERIARQYACQYNLPLTVARPAMAYGPGDLHLLTWFQAIDRGLYHVVGSGENKLHPIFVDDVIDGIIRCASVSTQPGRVYHLAGKQMVTIRELAAAIGRALQRRINPAALPVPLAMGIATLLESMPLPPSRLPLTRSRVRYMTESRVYQAERAYQELGFVPQVGLETGLQRTVDWYRQEGLL